MVEYTWRYCSFNRMLFVFYIANIRADVRAGCALGMDVSEECHFNMDVIMT